MALRATTVRFDRWAYELIQDEAERAGMTVAQFIREAALIRATLRAVADAEALTAPDIARAVHLCSERLVALNRQANDDGG